MPILGVVLLLDDETEATRRVAAEQLACFRNGEVELGERVAHRWPAVIEATTTEEMEARVDALRAVPGVAGVDVVFADFEDQLQSVATRHASEEL